MKADLVLRVAHVLRTWLINSQGHQAAAGPPKTDSLDAIWLCKVAERRMIRTVSCRRRSASRG
jgi:hypothetical protein